MTKGHQKGNNREEDNKTSWKLRWSPRSGCSLSGCLSKISDIITDDAVIHHPGASVDATVILVCDSMESHWISFFSLGFARRAYHYDVQREASMSIVLYMRSVKKAAPSEEHVRQKEVENESTEKYARSGNHIGDGLFLWEQ